MSIILPDSAGGEEPPQMPESFGTHIFKGFTYTVLKAPTPLLLSDAGFEHVEVKRRKVLCKSGAIAEFNARGQCYFIKGIDLIGNRMTDRVEHRYTKDDKHGNGYSLQRAVEILKKLEEDYLTSESAGFQKLGSHLGKQHYSFVENPYAKPTRGRSIPEALQSLMLDGGPVADS